MIDPHYAALFIGILIGTCGQLLLKIGALRSAGGVAQFLDPYTLMGLAAYAVSAIFYIFAIKKIPISLAYPSVSLSYVAVTLAAHFLFHERIGMPQLAGIALIWGGILLLYRT